MVAIIKTGVGQVCNEPKYNAGGEEIPAGADWTTGADLIINSPNYDPQRWSKRVTVDRETMPAWYTGK